MKGPLQYAPQSHRSPRPALGRSRERGSSGLNGLPAASLTLFENEVQRRCTHGHLPLYVGASWHLLEPVVTLMSPETLLLTQTG